ncbi:MAG: IclR family transcriptional regulator [Acidimicrobiales bacterium]
MSAQTGTRSVDRAVSLLRLLSERGALGLAEIARTLSVPKSSTADLLRALVARDFVDQDREGRYRLGLGAFEIGAAYLRSMTPVASVEPELEALTGELSATSHFAVLDGNEVVYLAKRDPPFRGLELASALGARLPAATTAVGKAQLAFVSPRDVEVRFDASRFVEFARIRTLGYALDEGGSAPGVTCVAAPVFSTNGCCGAIGVSTLVQGEPTREAIIDAVIAAAAHATIRLGGVRPHTDAVELGRTPFPGCDVSLRRNAVR